MPVDALPSDVLADIISFVGPGHHRYVAGTCRRYRSEYSDAISAQYLTAAADEEEEANEEQFRTRDGIAAAERARVTFWSSAAASVPCASLCLEDHRAGGCLNAEYAAVRRIGEAAARTGRLDVVVWLAMERGFDPDEHSGKVQRKLPFAHWLDFWRWGWAEAVHKLAADCAAAGGHLQVLEYFIEKGYIWDKWTGAMAAYGGHINILELLIGPTCPMDPIVCAAAAAGGRVEVLKHLQELGVEFDDYTLPTACEFGQMDAVKYLHESCGCALRREEGAAAARGGYLDVMKYLRANGCPWDEQVFWQAARSGRVGLVKYLREGGCPWSSTVLEEAAREGHLHVVEYLCENGCPSSHLAPVRAAQAGHLDVLRHLHESRCPWDVGTFVVAAELGDSEMLRYLHCNECPWGPEVCAAAARGGNLEALRFLREQAGCPWDETTITVAKYKRHADVVEWATKNGCPAPH